MITDLELFRGKRRFLHGQLLVARTNAFSSLLRIEVIARDANSAGYRATLSRKSWAFSNVFAQRHR